MKMSRLALAVSLACLASGSLLAEESDKMFNPSLLIELEAMKANNADLYDNTNNRDITDQSSKIELGLGVKISPWVKGDFLLVYEVNDEDKYELNWDDALFTFGNTDVFPITLGLGKTTAPFGAFETLMITDPYTQDMAETKAAMALLTYEAENGFFAKGYVFDKKVNDRKGSDFNNGGFQIGYAKETEERTINAGLGWMANIGGTDGIRDTLRDRSGFNEPGAGPYALGGGRMRHDVPGIALHLVAKQGPVTLIGEYITATRSFNGTRELGFGNHGAKPAALNLEAGYTWESGLLGKETTLGVGYQKTWEALDLGLPEERVAVGLGVEVYKHTTLKLEWAKDRAYGSRKTGNAILGDTGTGDTVDTWTAQLAFEF
jgi:hypothetical protein